MPDSPFPGLVGEIPTPLRELNDVHRRQLLDLRSKAQNAVKRRLDSAADRLRQRLNDIDPDSFEAQQIRVIETLAELSYAETREDLKQVVRTVWKNAAELAPAHAADEFNRWLQHYGHEARPLNLRALAELDESILLESIQPSLDKWGQSVASAVRNTLADATAERAFTEDVVDRVTGAIDGERWKADRIVRTELSHAYNKSHHKTLERARSPDGLGMGDNLQKSAIAALDARMDDDSIPVHGQVVKIGDPFIDGDGRRYLHPPGRPNDREKEIPWMDESAAQALAERPEPLN